MAKDHDWKKKGMFDLEYACFQVRNAVRDIRVGGSFEESSCGAVVDVV